MIKIGVFGTLGLFTRQNTLLTNIFLLLSLNNKFKKSKYYPYLSFICLINCLIVMFFCLSEKKPYFVIDYFFEHKILSLMFIFYYFFINASIIKLKKFYIGLIYPLIYFSIMFILIKIDNEKLNPYWKEINRNKINNQTLLFFAFLTSLIILIVSFCLVFLKNKIIANKQNITFIKKYKKGFYLLSILVLSFFVFSHFIK